ncbi:putative disease resistance RPP8-like protein 2 [Carex rostrata]
MDALPFIREMISEPTLRDFLSNNVPVDEKSLDLIVVELVKVQMFMTRANFRVQPEDQKQALIEGLRLTARKVGNFMREIVGSYSKNKSSGSERHDLVKDWKETLDFIIGIVVSCNFLKHIEEEGEWDDRDMVAVVNSLNDINKIENLQLDTADNSNCITLDAKKSRALLLMKAFPKIRELNESEMLQFFLELSKELDNLPQLICNACEQQPLALLLIGSLLSLKQRSYDTWKRIKDDLYKVKDSDNSATNNHTWHILTYCYDDLPHFLKPCFLYLACYPINYEIPARSLIEIWISEGFITPVNGETREETGNKYLEQLVQRSLVWVSKTSLLGTIRYFKVHPSVHEFSIQQSLKDGFLVANPDRKKMDSLFRMAIHHDDKNQYTEVENNHMHSFLAFNFDRNVIGSAVFLRVLELRNSSIPETVLLSMTYLRYLGLRGSKNISQVPENIGDMKNLETLDVRDTSVKTLPGSIWNISKLRHVYVNPSPHIKGPPSEAHIPDLQTLKTVVVPESWKEKFPQFLINLRKLAISNRDNPDEKSNPYWNSISILLSRMVNLLSITIIADILPSEFVDTRAFQNLKTVKSIKFEGEWICRKLFIDNIAFPPNLAKLILTKSGLKEDPIPRLAKLEALKYLSLQDGVYSGEKMVCPENGFPQLEFLELKKLVNLKSLEVKPMALSQLATLRVVLCPNLKKPHLRVHVTIEGIDNPGNLENVSIENIDN